MLFQTIEKPDLIRAKYLKTFGNKMFEDKCCRGKKSKKEIDDLYKKSQNYLSDVISSNGILSVEYKYPADTIESFGNRMYSVGGIQKIPSLVRNFLYQDKATDIDMVSAHPKILENMCKIFGFHSPNLSYYLQNRDEIRSLVSKDKDIAKEKILAMMNDNTFRCHNGTHPTIKAFAKEFRDIQDFFWEIPEFQPIKDITKPKKPGNIKGSFLNHILCIYENRIIQKVISHLQSKNIHIFAVMFDGCLVEGNFYDDNNLLIELEKYADEVFPNSGIKFEYKPLETTLSLPEDFNPDDICDFELMNALEQGEDAMSDFLIPIFQDKLVYSNKLWFYCDPDLWIQSDSCSVKLITSTISNLIKSSMNPQYPDICKKFKDFLPKISKSGYTNQIIHLLKDCLLDTEFHKKIDNYKNKFVFQNGIFHLDTNTFTEGFQPSDFISKTTRLDYYEPSQEQLDFVNHELFKICNCNESHLNYYKSALGYALTGLSDIELFIFSLYGPTASNGKSIILDSLAYIAPDYISSIDNKFFNKGNAIDKTISSMSKTNRIIYLNELDTSKLDISLIKLVADGGVIKYKRLYGGEDYMPVNFKCIVVSNSQLNFDSDEGMNRRLRTMELSSSFKDVKENDYQKRIFIRDPSFANELKTTLAIPLLYLLFQSAYEYNQTKSLAPYPSDWEAENDEILNDNDEINDWFFSTYELNKDSFISKANFEADLGFAKISRKDFKNFIKKNKFDIYYNDQKMIHRKKGVWFGFRLLSSSTQMDDTDGHTTEETDPLY